MNVPVNRRAILGIAFAVQMMFAGSVGAQTVNPNVLTFVPSATHDSIGPSGRPVVSGYALELYRMGSARPETVIDLGKPAPGLDGRIRVDVAASLAGARLTGELLEAKVIVVGPWGSSSSPASNLFELDACRYLLPAGVSIDSGGGTMRVAIATSGACAWQARSSAAWLSETAGSSGVGEGWVSMHAGANPSSGLRVGLVSVGPQILLVFQPGASPASSSMPAR